MKPARLFSDLEHRLIQNHADAHENAKRLSECIVDPCTADANAIWRAMWDKPLYANAKDGTASTWEIKIEPFVGTDSWKKWGISGRNGVLIEKTGKGVVNKSFSLLTPLAEEIRNKTNIALYRLFAIQSAATALRKRSESSEKAPFCDLVAAHDFSSLLSLLRKEFGAGWGDITVCHFLTDLGLACKPDLHLTRSVRYLGLISGKETNGNKTPTRKEIVLINERVRELVKDLYGNITPEKLRYVDSVLMRISQKGLLQAA